MYFCFEARPANSKFATKTAEKKCECCHSSHLNYQKRLKRLQFFRNFRDGWRRQTFLSASHRKCILLSETVPYNKHRTNPACSSRTVEYWPWVVFVRNSLRSVRTVTTSLQYSPVRPLCSVSKRLIIFLKCLYQHVKWKETQSSSLYSFTHNYKLKFTTFRTSNYSNIKLKLLVRRST